MTGDEPEPQTWQEARAMNARMIQRIHRDYQHFAYRTRWTLRIMALVLIVSLGISGILIQDNKNQVQQLQHSRYQSRYDSCHLLRDIVFEATPPRQSAVAKKFINHSKLRNCHLYAEENN